MNIAPLSPLSIGDAIKQRLLALGKTQTAGAELLGISDTYLSVICLGRTTISVYVARKLHLIGLNGLELFLAQAMHQYGEYPHEESNIPSETTEPEAPSSTLESLEQEGGNPLQQLASPRTIHPIPGNIRADLLEAVPTASLTS